MAAVAAFQLKCSAVFECPVAQSMPQRQTSTLSTGYYRKVCNRSTGKIFYDESMFTREVSIRIGICEGYAPELMLYALITHKGKVNYSPGFEAISVILSLEYDLYLTA